jgi:polyisoprenoid-binding protein YceI
MILVVVIVGIVALVLAPAPSPLTLPRPGQRAAGAIAPIDGSWTAEQGSVAGYRVQEEFLGIGNTVVGRSTAVTGRVVISLGEVSSASFRVDLATVEAGGKTQPQLAGIMDTKMYPDATFMLTTPIVLRVPPTVNKSFVFEAIGLLTMHGTTRMVTVAITARDTGSILEATGSIPVHFSQWNIQSPVENSGDVEFLLMLRR